MPSAQIAWLAVAAAIVIFMQAGFTLFHAGLARPKNGVNIAVVRVTDTLTAALAFWVCGFGLMFGASRGGLVGATGFFFVEDRAANGSLELAFFCLQLASCTAAAAVLSGAVNERMPFRGHFAITAFLVAVIYPVFGHWAWGGGWLQAAHFVDFAGATVIHSVAGWAALAALLVVGNRTGVYTRRGVPVRRPTASPALAAIGVLFIWFAWISWSGAQVASEPALLARVVVDVMVAGAAGGVVALAGARLRNGVLEIEPVLQGALAGLVAISAGCHAVEPAHAVVIGGIAGAVMLGVAWLLERLRIDDAVGAVPVHLGGGLWGTIAVALFADGGALGTGLSRLAQLRVQLIGAAACAAWSFGAGYLAFRAIRARTHLRVSPDDELAGLNVSEHLAATERMDVTGAIEAGAATINAREPFVERALVAIDAGGRVISSTPAASAIFGHGEGELRRLSIEQLFAPARDARVDVAALAALVGAPPRELVGARRSGEQLPVEVSVTAGEHTSLVVSLQDLTERKDREEGLTRTQAEIVRRFRRELAGVKILGASGTPAELALGTARVALTAPPAAEWFGCLHAEATSALVLHSGEFTGEAGVTAALLASGGGMNDDGGDTTHGLLLGDGRFTPARQLQNLAEVLNRIVVQTGRGELQVPMLFAHLDLPTGALHWISAGGAAALWLKNGRNVRSLGGGGAGEAIGASSDARYQVQSVDLLPGDVVLLCATGLVDSFGPAGTALTSREVRKILLHRDDPKLIRDEIMARGRAVWGTRLEVLGVTVVRFGV